MKCGLLLAALTGIFVGATARAARLTVDPPYSPTGVYTFYLYGGSTVFNGVGLSIKPSAGAQFLDVVSGNAAGAPRSPGDPFTYRNRLLDADPLEFPESKQWTLLGVINTPQELAFSGGPLGQTIDTSGEVGGWLFLATIKLPPGASATGLLQLVNGVDTVYVESVYILPEPAATGMMGLGTLALLVRRRHSLGRMRT